ncbi:alginate export family protein [Mucilaginibacter sp. UR6-1]|uniref:alginate export family protein n=1 Tax=Mucilaginibacter sp. UR6-1 TaxID=1435643 RepID=UPI001E4DF1A3|nr:alginate export family protein [Mucilaginibacter sp. UR6-1]MCC8407813.1 alginate export family protein [Mucilaginibacter sp. UR6-1]
MKVMIAVLLSLLMSGTFVHAQRIRLLRFDEDHSDLKDSARTFYNTLKYLPLSQGGSTYLSFGGEARFETDRSQNEDWGSRGFGSQSFLLQRYQLHADLHLGKRVRIFGQMRSAMENGRKSGPRPIDEDHLNVQNLFVDLIPYEASGKKITVRLGRQELQYGSGRLIDVQEGPNLRLYFDGAKVAYSSVKFSIDGFVMGNGGVKTGVFDNPLGRKARLWGVYSTWRTARQINIDLSYLGISRSNAVFDEGIANEKRHIVGARFWNTGNGFLYNLEAGYQFGAFGNGKVRAWGGSADIGYRFSHLKGMPLLNLRSDLISGDRKKGDGILNTMNPLYPNGGYFGVIPQAGPANLLSLHPSLAWNPARKLNISLGMVFNWRESLEDGIYRPSGIFNLSSSGSDKRYIGTSYMGMLTWNISPHLLYIFGAQYFDTGAYLDDIISQPKDGFFLASMLAFKF